MIFNREDDYTQFSRFGIEISSFSTLPKSEQTEVSFKVTLCVLAILLMLAGVVATGYLFSYVGYSALGLLPIPVAGLILFVIAPYCKAPSCIKSEEEAVHESGQAASSREIEVLQIIQKQKLANPNGDFSTLDPDSLFDFIPKIKNAAVLEKNTCRGKLKNGAPFYLFRHHVSTKRDFSICDTGYLLLLKNKERYHVLIQGMLFSNPSYPLTFSSEFLDELNESEVHMLKRYLSGETLEIRGCHYQITPSLDNRRYTNLF